MDKHEEEDVGAFQEAFDHSSRAQRNQPVGRKNKRRAFSAVQATVKPHHHFGVEHGISNSSIPGVDPPGIFLDAHIPWSEAEALVNGIAIDDENGIEEFHDSDSEDIFTLYNACDGAMRGRFLDIRKLDELSAEELEVLDIGRLREIWIHTTSGCATCAEIIETLNSVRGVMAGEEDILLDSVQAFGGKPH